MANYPFVSGKVILANVIRGLGYKLPSTYIDDILEWIPEGLGLMQVTNSMVAAETGDQDCPGQLLVKNHCVKLPCGFQGVISISDDCGRRLHVGNDVANRRITDTQLRLARMSTFNVNPYTYQTSDGLPTDEPGPSIPIFGQDLEQSNDVITDRIERFYSIQGNYIQTSFEEGYIKLRYWAIPVCSEGYPMVPDNSNFKLALEWHILRRLIGSGYQHPVFDYKLADEKFEFYAGRGMSEVFFPTPDKMAATNNHLIRLIPPDKYTEEFFINN